MIRQNIEDQSFSSCLRKYCGRAIGGNAEVNSSAVLQAILLLYVAQVDGEILDFDSRLEQIHIQFPDLGETTTESAASSGFTVSDDSSFLKCPACKTGIEIEHIPNYISNLLRLHSSSCPYPLLFRTDVGEETFQHGTLKTIMAELLQQWFTTKVVLALEDFPACLVAIALIQQFIRNQTSFNSAGDLVDRLIDVDDVIPFLWDLSPVTEKLERMNYNARKENSETERISLARKGAFSQSQIEASTSQSIPDPAGINESLISETIQLLYRWRCKVCGKQDGNIFHVDCSVISLCSSCLDMTDKCPICLQPLTNTVKIFVS